MSRRVQPRRGTAASAALSNPILLAGEKGYETDTKRWKTGDGVTPWNDLLYDDAGEAEGNTWNTLPGKPSTFPPSTHTHTQAQVTGLEAALAALQAGIDGKTTAAATASAITAAINALKGDAAAGYDTLGELEDAILAISATAPENHYLKWTGSAWPSRPAGALPVIWVGGASPTDAPASFAAGDVWIPTTGDNIDLGAVVEALQLLTMAANKIPYFTSTSAAGLLTRTTDGTLAGNSDTNIPSEKAVKTYVDAVNSLVTALTSTVSGHTTSINANTAAIAGVTPNRQTASYSLVVSDVNKCVEMNVATANNLTVTANGTQAIPVNSVIEVYQYGAGQTTLVPDTGVTIRSSGNKLKLTGQYSSCSLRKIGTNEWAAQGDLSA